MKSHVSIVLHPPIEDQDDEDLLSADELDELCDLALKGIRRPKSMTPGQIQEIAWGFLVVARQLAERPRVPS